MSVIADPVGRSLSVYRDCARELDQALDRLQHKILSHKTNLTFPSTQPFSQGFPLLKWIVGLVRIP